MNKRQKIILWCGIVSCMFFIVNVQTHFVGVRNIGGRGPNARYQSAVGTDYTALGNGLIAFIAVISSLIYVFRTVKSTDCFCYKNWTLGKRVLFFMGVILVIYIPVILLFAT